ncbi:MAG: ABC transporter permease, partial [Ancalomicrobiaceae bacterium]|nr:ABC transporter permease [Ancalomicrobiaceae bacterium]
MIRPAAVIAALGLATRLARRELRAGLGGFRVFIASIALGVAAIAAVGSLADTMRASIATEGSVILGADISFSLIHRRATADERAWLATLGQVSEVATLRAMARREGPRQPTAAGSPPVSSDVLVEVKAVDPAYPLYGTVAADGLSDAEATGATKGPGDWRQGLDPARSGLPGALVERALLSRLGVSVGDTVALGAGKVVIAGVITSEPDKIGGGIGFGPRLMLATASLATTGLAEAGSLTRWTYRVKLAGSTPTAARLAAIRAEADSRFPQAGWEIRDAQDAAPGLSANIRNFAAFLTLVGITALTVGGVGVANAVAAFVERKRETIAVLKSLGASGGLAVAVAALQVAFVTAVGVVLGLLGGVALAAIALYFLADLLPVAPLDSLHPLQLLLAAAYGCLTAVVFVLWPLGLAHDLRPTLLFRDEVEPAKTRPRPAYLASLALAVAVLAGLALATAPDVTLAASYIAALAGIFVVLRLIAVLVAVLARRLPRPRRMEARLALANLHRPGNATASVLLSLGLGLTLTVALGLIEVNLRGQLGAQVSSAAPSFFFLDVAKRDLDGFSNLIARDAPAATLERVPMLRGRIAELHGLRADRWQGSARAAFLLRGDRGLTFSDSLPKGSTLTAGTWWDKDYAGPPLVSMEQGLAEALELHLGDKLKVNVLGRDIEVRIGSLRKVTWSTFGINFFMVFSPNTFNGAPISYLATVAFPPATPEAQELQLAASIAADFPTATAIRVKDQLAAIDTLLSELALAVAAAASVTILTAVVVLAGAFASGQRRRRYDAAILKALGATRAQILTTLVIEFVGLAVIAAALATAAGSIVAFYVVHGLMGFDFLFSGAVAGGVTTLAILVTVFFGLSGTWG